MNINEFEMIKEKLEKYDLVDEIENISKWFRRINDRHIDNFLSLKYDDSLKELKSLLINIGFLGSYTYLSDVKLLKQYSDKKIDVNEITNLLIDPNFIKSPHHKKDLEYILDVDDEKARKFLIKLTRSTSSIYSKFHEEDMKSLYTVISVDTNQNRIKNDKYDLYENFVDYAVKYSNLNIKDKDNIHVTDGYKILDAKSVEISKKVKEVALNKESLMSNYHKKDIGYISNASDHRILDYLSKLACNKKSLESNYHEEDMSYVSNAKDYHKAYILYSFAKEDTVNRYIIDSVFKCNDSFVLRKLSNLIIEYGLNNIMPYIDLIIKSSGDKQSMLCDLVEYKDNLNIYLIIKFYVIKDFPAAEMYYNFLFKNMDNKDILNEVLDKISGLSDFEVCDFLANYVNEEEKVKKVTEEKVLTNREKLDIMYKNALKYVDDNKCDEISSKVFIIK